MRSLALLVILNLGLTTFVVADDWPQWRGPERDGKSAETGLLQEWTAEGPALRWKRTDVGTGYSSPSIANGRVFVQTTRGEEEFALALDEQSGDDLWSASIGKVGKNRGPQYPGTRSTPTVDGDLIYCLSSDGELSCLDAASGDQKWQRKLKDDFGGADGAWAYSESVLIDGDAVICTPGGDRASLVALNKLTGEVVWECAVPEGGTAEYASIMTATTDDRRQYVQYLRNGLVGVDATTGQLLWKYDKTVDPGANILTPIVDGQYIFSAGSRTGGALIELAMEGDGVAVTEIYFDRKLSPSIGGAVLLDGHLYGATQSGLFCADFRTGENKWQDRSVGAASVCYADGRLYVRGHKSGEMALVEPTSEAYREHGRFEQPDRSEKPAWPHPVVSNGALYVRDWESLLCYEIKTSE